MVQEVRHSPQLAQWLSDQGCEVMQWNPEVDMEIEDGLAVNTDSLIARGLSLADIQPGDLVFFAEKSGGEYVEQNDYRHISHVAIVNKAEQVRNEIGEPVGWKHEIIEVISVTSALAHGAKPRDREYLADEATYCAFDIRENPFYYDTMQIRSLWVDPVVNDGLEFDGELAWGGTMVMVCRPQLTAANTDFGLIAEAKKLGLHEMPVSWGALNVVRRARQFTDVKWTPAVDLRRYTLKYEDDGDPVFYQNARFKAGVEYTGVPGIGDEWPLFHAVGKDCGFTAFVTSMAVENTENTSYDPDDDGVYDLVSGWRDGKDLIRYAFDVPVFDKTSGVKGCFETARVNTDIKLGDVFGEEAIVTDIIRSGGVILYIEVCTATFDGCDNSADLDGPKCGLAVRKLMPYIEFENKYRGDTYWEHLPVGLRYNDIESVEYFPDPYVPISEPDSHPTRNFPIIPYCGHKSVQCVNVSDLEPEQGEVEFPTLLIPNDPEYTLYARGMYTVGPIADALDENGRIRDMDFAIVDSYDHYAGVVDYTFALAESLGDGEYYLTTHCEHFIMLHSNNPVDVPSNESICVKYDDVNNRFLIFGIDMTPGTQKTLDQVFLPRYIRWNGSYYPFIRFKKPLVGYVGYDPNWLMGYVDADDLLKDSNGETAELPITVTIGYYRPDGGASFEIQEVIPAPEAGE